MEFLLNCLSIICFACVSSARKGYHNQIYSRTSDFLAVAKTPAFVDKTDQLESIFGFARWKMITAPPGFGKSTNLDMIRRFASTRSRDDQSIRTLFEGLKVYKKHRKFFNEHFGQHPVVHVDFQCGGIIRKREDAVGAFARAINRAFIEHDYLKSCVNLTANDFKACNVWCGGHNMKNIQPNDVYRGLYVLAKMLRMHFQRKVIFLVDEYDSVFNSALAQTKGGGEFPEIAELTTDVLGSMLTNNENVLSAVVMGVSYLTTAGLPDILGVEKYRFLEDQPLVPFNGFLSSEVEDLFGKQRFNLGEERAKKAYTVYKGYVSYRQITIFNPSSVLKFLESGVTARYWLTPDYVTRLVNYFKFPEIVDLVDTLLQFGPIKATINKDIDSEKALKLADMINPSKEILQPNTDLFAAILMERGYLSYVEVSHKYYPDVYLNLTNRDVEESLLSVYKEHYISVCKLDRNSMKNLNYADFRAVLENSGCSAYIPETYGKESAFSKLYRYVSQILKTFIPT